MASLKVLEIIAAHDPDGQLKEPTEADYELFERWVVKMYGRETWKEYNGSNWRTSELW